MTVLDPALLDRVRRRVATAGAPVTAAAVAAALREEGGALRGDAELLPVLRLLQSEIVGAGPLEPLLRDPRVTDVLVNAHDDVWVDRGGGLERVAVRFPDDLAVRRLAQRLAAPTGRRLDDAQPWVDARLADGVRLHAVLPPVAPGGTCLSLRVPRRRVFTLEELVAAGSLPPDGAELLAAVVASRAAFLVTGGTGTGKTTLLSALLSLVDPQDRLLLVEDAGELAPSHPHVVRLEARPPNLEGAGAVTLRDLVRQALRMRPDRVVVGEVRGGEVVEMLAALNTGHEGGCGTLHANSARDVPARLEALAAVAGLGREALHSQLASGLRLAVHLARGRDGRRRLAEVCVLQRSASGLVEAEVAWSWDGRTSGGRPGPAAAVLAAWVSDAGAEGAAAELLSAPWSLGLLPEERPG
jgi:pilus assembly protein CpaF